MRRIAMNYDHLAKLAEEQIADQERGTQRQEISRWGFPHCPEPHATERS
jgi:hypothetical protein